MSTLKSSAEDLTLNADGADNDIILQSNASTKVLVDGATGNLGVGTNTPVMASTSYNGLHVNATYPTVKLTANALGHAATDGFHLRIDSTPRVEYWNYENTDQVFANNNGVKLRLLAAGGLCFGTDTAAANALDDYEEGTFTPTINNPGDATDTEQTGYYTKIGNVVNIWGVLTINSIGTATGSSLGGLPFTVTGTSGGWFTTYVGSLNRTAGAYVVGQCATTTTRVDTFQHNTAAGVTAMTPTTFSDGADLYFHGNYRA